MVQATGPSLNGFLEKITATEETVAPVSLEDLIAKGESDELEFKSTLPSCTPATPRDTLLQKRLSGELSVVEICKTLSTAVTTRQNQ